MTLAHESLSWRRLSMTSTSLKRSPLASLLVQRFPASGGGPPAGAPEPTVPGISERIPILRLSGIPDKLLRTASFESLKS